MSVRNAGSISRFRALAAPKTPKPAALVVKGPGVAKLATAGVSKAPELPSLSVLARRGLAPKEQLAKAAAGGSSRSKRNPNYPTP